MYNLRNPKSSEPGLRAVLLLDKYGLPVTVENYRVFYTACSGADHKLGNALRQLGEKPTQAEVDEVARRFFPDMAAESFAQQATGRMGRELDALSSTLNNEQKDIGDFKSSLSMALDRFLASRESGRPVTAESVAEFARALAQAVRERQASGTKVAKEVGNAASEMRRMQDEIEHYKRLSETDPLTKLKNRRAFDEKMAALYSQEKPAGAVFVMDIDRFKKINDTYGHPIGDLVIKAVAARIRMLVRGETFVARTGGEEFAVIVQDTDRDQDLEIIGERIRAGVEQLDLVAPGGVKLPRVTVSVGVCSAADAEDGADLYQKADQALYGSKNRGRNMVSFYEVPEHDADEQRRYQMIYSR